MTPISMLERAFPSLSCHYRLGRHHRRRRRHLRPLRRGGGCEALIAWGITVLVLTGIHLGYLL